MSCKVVLKEPRQELELISSLPKEKYLEIGDQMETQNVILVPVTTVQEDHPVLYLETGSVLTCRAFLNESDAESYLDMISAISNIDAEDLQFCPLPIKKLVASLTRISGKAQKPIVCVMMIKYEGFLQDAGIFWTNHQPFMV